MSKSVRYSCNIIQARGKQRVLKTDDNGYHEICVGGFNMYNEQGKFYPLLPAVKAMFETGGAVRRMLDKNLLRGEYTHPYPEPGQSLSDYINRVCRIEPTLVSHHFQNIELRPGKDDKGRAIVLAIALVKGSGPYGDSLEKSLTNTEENVAFSIRSMADDVRSMARLEKHIRSIITWDHVNEPGKSVATKYHTPSLEGFMEDDDLIVSMEALQAARRANAHLGLESDENVTRVLTDLGWEIIEVANAWMKW